jgi:hypothetical protein
MGAEDIEQEWVVGWCRAPFVMDEPDPHRPNLVLLLDVEAGRVSAFTTIPHEAADEQVASWVEENAPPGVDLRVADAGLASAVRSEGGHHRFVYVGPTPEVDAVLDEVRGNIRRHRPQRRLPAQPDESSSRVRRAFYEAAACFDEAAPRTLASDQMVMGVSIPGLGWTKACAVVLGEAGSGEPVPVGPRLPDPHRHRAGRRRGPGLHRRGRSRRPRRLLRRPGEGAGGTGIGEEGAGPRLDVWPRGFVPWLIHVGTDGVPKRLTTDDYTIAIAGLVGVAVFLSAHGRLLHERIEAQLATTAAVETDAGSVDVRVYVPLEDPPPRATPMDVD